MTTLETIRARSSWRDILENQPQHLAILAFMLSGFAFLLPAGTWPSRFLGLSAWGWACLSVWLAVAHQVIVAAVFRLQLHRGMMTRLFGDSDLRVWGRIFFPFLLARPLTILIIGLVDGPSLGLSRPVELLVGVALLGPAVFTFWSVHRYFSFERAVGGDHFRDEIAARPLVREGAFKWSGNAMYTYGFLILWAIAFLCGSTMALLVAAFQHTYIWVHMLCTENPDMDWIYGGRANRVA